MSEMIERVARALCDAVDYQIEADVLARAAIEAMREPTEAMIAGSGITDGDEFRFEYAGAAAECARETWQAMIDSALSTPQPV